MKRHTFEVTSRGGRVLVDRCADEQEARELAGMMPGAWVVRPGILGSWGVAILAGPANRKPIRAPRGLAHAMIAGLLLLVSSAAHASEVTRPYAWPVKDPLPPIAEVTEIARGEPANDPAPSCIGENECDDPEPATAGALATSEAR